MRNSAPHDIELCRTISTEFNYRSLCLISLFNFRSRSTYLLWILFQFRQSDRIRFIIIQQLFAHNNIDHYRSDLRILYARKNSVRETSLGPGPLFCGPFRALIHTCSQYGNHTILFWKLVFLRVSVAFWQTSHCRLLFKVWNFISRYWSEDLSLTTMNIFKRQLHNRSSIVFLSGRFASTCSKKSTCPWKKMNTEKKSTCSCLPRCIMERTNNNLLLFLFE